MKQMDQALLFIRFFQKGMILASLLAIGLGGPGCAANKNSPAGSLTPVTIGIDGTAVSALILIADDQNFFAENGLQAQLKEYPSGLAAVGGMQKNEVEIATAAEFVIVGKALADEKIHTWGSIDKFMHNYLVARKDRGVETIADLEGKKIGVPLKTAAEFYLGRFLELHNMAMTRVSLVNVSPADSVEALVSGTVDAIMVWEPNATIIEDRMQAGILKWPVQNEQPTYCVLVSSRAWTQANPAIVKQFLKALAQAESFTANRPEAARAIVQKRLKYEEDYMAVIWPKHQFQLALEQSLILAMEDEARWMINNRLTERTETPVFLDYVYIDPLQAVKPDAVNIIQ